MSEAIAYKPNISPQERYVFISDFLSTALPRLENGQEIDSLFDADFPPPLRERLVVKTIKLYRISKADNPYLYPQSFCPTCHQPIAN